MKLPDIVTENLSSSAIENINQWLNEPKYSEYKSELEALIADQNWKYLEDAFFKVIEFGTGGRRGTTGLGSNRVNRVTIGESAQALCEYAIEADPQAANKGVVIAYDTRLSSPELSKYAAQVCAANGFKTYLFDSFRATPELSFAVRHLQAAIGIVISASHNPPADNGFKAYWSDGGQLVSPHDKGVLAKASEVKQIKNGDYDEFINQGRIVLIGRDVDHDYIAAAAAQSEGKKRNLNIVYSPLHGAGQTNVLPVLQAAGFEDISLVEAQMTPDGSFPTVKDGKPNPEEKAANDLAVTQLMAEEADIAITNDPDADRIGVIVRANDRPVYLSGNQSAVLATDYALQKKQQAGRLTKTHYIAKTIVTTDMLSALAQSYRVKLYGDMLVGFKYIGELILSKEDSDETFVIGAEESYGLLKGDYARDKDGATGALALAEYAAELKSEGKNLYGRLLELYAEHGLYVERLDTVVSPGADGFERMQQIMHNLRTSPPSEVGEYKVTAISDYASLIKTQLTTVESEVINCKSGDVVALEFGDSRRRITVRPSGTEPKLKFYIQWYSDVDESDVEKQYERLNESLKSLSKELESILIK